jgi:hypothetical protein
LAIAKGSGDGTPANGDAMGSGEHPRTRPTVHEIKSHFFLRGRGGTVSLPRGFFGGGDDSNQACDDGVVAPIFGHGDSPRWWLAGDGDGENGGGAVRR